MPFIREARWEDVSKIEKLLTRSFGQLLRNDYPASVLSIAVPLLARAQPALVTSGRYYVAELGGKIVGVGGWSLEAPGTNSTQRGVAHMRHVAVDPDHLRKGIGFEILLQSLAAANKYGIKRMMSLSTLTAAPFYEGCGFIEVGRRETPLGVAELSFPGVEMQLDLPV